MSGHSKFANIKHKKEKNDAAKGKIFTIIGREIEQVEKQYMDDKVLVVFLPECHESLAGKKKTNT